MKIGSLLCFLLMIIWPSVGMGQTPISCGQTVTGSITTVSGVNTYTLAINANDQVWVRLHSVSTNLGSWTPEVSVYGSGGSLLGRLAGDGNLFVPVGANRTVTVALSAQNDAGTGGYEFTVQKLNNACNASVLPCGQVVSGTVNAVTGMEAYQLAVSPGDQVIVNVHSTTTLSGAFAAETFVTDEFGNLVGISLGDSAQEVFVTNGNYLNVVVVANYRTGTGTYSLMTERLDNPCGAKVLSCGQTVAGSITNSVAVNFYSLAVNPNDQVWVRMHPTSTTSGTWMPVTSMYDESGNLLGGLTNDGNFYLPVGANGTVSLGVSGLNEDGTGGYEFTVQRVNDVCDATTLKCGQLTSGAVDSVTGMEPYQLAVSPGDQLLLDVHSTATLSGAFNAITLVLDDEGNIIGESAADSSLEVTVTNGIYVNVLVLANQRTGTGTYNLLAQNLNDPCDATILSCGQTVTASITNVVAANFYTLAVNPNDQLWVRLHATSTISGTWMPVASVYDEIGNLLGELTNDGNLYLPVGANGTVSLGVSALNENGTGGYEFTVQRVNDVCNAGTLACGQIITGTVGSVTAMEPYQVAVAP